MHLSLLCLLTAMATAMAVTISGGASLNGKSVQGSVSFPLFPRLRAPAPRPGGVQQPGKPVGPRPRPRPSGGLLPPIPGLPGRGGAELPKRPPHHGRPIRPPPPIFPPRPRPTTTTTTTTTTQSSTATTEPTSAATTEPTSAATTESTSATSTESTSAETTESTESTSAGTTEPTSATSTESTSAETTESTESTSAGTTESTESTESTASTEDANETTTDSEGQETTTDADSNPAGRRRRQFGFSFGSQMGMPVPSFNVPDVSSLVSNIPNLDNLSGASTPEIAGPTDVSSLPPFPGLREAVQEARDLALDAMGGGTDMASGLHEAMDRALVSPEPAQAITDMFTNIISAYIFIASKCPVMIVGSYLLQEGSSIIYQAIEALNNMSFDASIGISS